MIVNYPLDFNAIKKLFNKQKKKKQSKYICKKNQQYQLKNKEQFIQDSIAIIFDRVLNFIKLYFLSLKIIFEIKDQRYQFRRLIYESHCVFIVKCMFNMNS